MMQERIKEEGAWFLRFATPIMVGMCLFILNDMRSDLQHMQETVTGNSIAIAVLKDKANSK